jgi:hypothetical protein
VRCNLLPECYVAPAEMRELRRLLRYRNVVVAQAVRMKNKMSGLLIEVGAEYNKQQLHGKKYFTELRATWKGAGIGEGSAASEPGRAGDVRGNAAAIAQPAARGTTAGRAAGGAEEHSRGGRGDGIDLGAGNLRSAAVPVDCGCRELLWADLGVGLFGRQAAPGTCSKQRNGHLQTVLIEAAKFAPQWNPQLARWRIRYQLA